MVPYLLGNTANELGSINIDVSLQTRLNTDTVLGTNPQGTKKRPV